MADRPQNTTTLEQMSVTGRWAFGLCFVAMGLFPALAAIGNWIAFGVGGRVCSGSVLFWTGGNWSGLACRIPFGFGAIMTNGILLLVLVVMSGYGIVKARLQTGSWPRNEAFIARKKAKK